MWRPLQSAAMSLVSAVPKRAIPGSLPWLTLALAVLAGALSFVPAGLGVIEASLFVLLSWRRVPAPEAAAVIVLFRLVTLWFGAGLAWALGAKRPELDAEA